MSSMGLLQFIMHAVLRTDEVSWWCVCVLMFIYM